MTNPDDTAGSPAPTPTPISTPVPVSAEAAPMGPEDFDVLDAELDAMREQDDEIPQWEFCEGFMAALICSRRPIPPAEYWPVVLGDSFVPVQRMEFVWHWKRRWNEIEQALDADVRTLDDDRSFQPEVLDTRGAIASLSEEERAEVADEAIPSFAQVWALGFMYAVENWPEDWAPPRDKEAAQMLDEALDAIVALTEDDTGKPEVSMFSEDGPPSLSQKRLDDFGEAIWAVYDLRQLWKSMGPRIEAVRKEATPGRNDPCHCGSGKKFKKCHGA
ncbi:YecA family protein [soil metagenome]